MKKSWLGFCKRGKKSRKELAWTIFFRIETEVSSLTPIFTIFVKKMDKLIGKSSNWLKFVLARIMKRSRFCRPSCVISLDKREPPMREKQTVSFLLLVLCVIL